MCCHCNMILCRRCGHCPSWLPGCPEPHGGGVEFGATWDTGTSLLTTSVILLYWQSKGDSMENDSRDGASGRTRSGNARMLRLTPEERKELGRKGAAQRWATDRQRIDRIHEPEAW